MTARRLRHVATGAFLAAILGAFVYGSAGCIAVRTVHDQPCPPEVRGKLRSRLQIDDCTGGRCRLMMVACFVGEPDLRLVEETP